MQSGHLFPVSSVDGVDFTGALAQNASAQADLLLPGAIAAGLNGRCRLRSAIAWSSQALALDFALYGAHDAKSADPNLDTFLGRWGFVAADWLQDDGAGLYRTRIDGLDIPYEDQDAAFNRYPQAASGNRTPPRLHLVLVNRDTVTKTAYGTGNHFRLAVYLEPTQGSGL